MPSYYGHGYGLPKAVKYLLIANAAVFALQILLPSVIPFGLLALVPSLITHYFMVWQFFTYMFLHGGFGHIGFNMFALWMFGTELEYNWGTRDFLKFYLISGIGGGVLVWLTSFVGLTDPLSSTIGASGAIFGLLVAYGLMWPDRVILLFGILPMRALQMVIVFGVISLFQGLTRTGGDIAVFAHLGGGVTGFIYLKCGWRIQVYLEHWMKRIARRRFTVIPGGRGIQAPRKDSDSMAHPDMDNEVDRILDKIAREGMESLDDRERRILKRESEKKHRQ
jgi:membrane associated rhomboid family serine protease